jgi:hypothetical protein
MQKEQTFPHINDIFLHLVDLQVNYNTQNVVSMLTN